jgi:hypothetical protein
MKLLWRVAARFNEARHRRASHAAAVFKARAEKFYRLIRGVQA